MIFVKMKKSEKPMTNPLKNVMIKNNQQGIRRAKDLANQINKEHDIIESLLSALDVSEDNASDPPFVQTGLAIKKFMDQMPGGFFIYHADENEQIIYANKAMLRIFNCDTMDEFRSSMGLGWDVKVDSISLGAYNQGRILKLWLSDTPVEDPGDDVEFEEEWESPNAAVYKRVAYADGTVYPQKIELGEAWSQEHPKGEAEIIEKPWKRSISGCYLSFRPWRSADALHIHEGRETEPCKSGME